MPVAYTSPSASDRLERARTWLAARSPAEPLLLVGAHTDAVHELVRRAALESATGALFGWYRCSLGRLAAELAGPALLERNRVPVSRLGSEALVARVAREVGEAGGLGRYEPVGEQPGFPRAVARTLEELRLGSIPGDRLAELAPGLPLLLERYVARLAEAGLADRATVLDLAADAAGRHEPGHPWLGLPTLLLDVPVWSEAEKALVAAVAARAPDVLATVPAGDEATEARLRDAGFSWDAPRPRPASDTVSPSLARLQAHLFEETTPPEAALGDDVVILSAPGESRECVEIARRLLAHAREGIPFDRMAVLLRSPEEYRPHLEEAFARAGIPAHFSRGAVRPDPAGRAFVALLACAAEGLSARRFAEYLSLGEVPDATSAGEPPPAAPAGERWVAPDEELVPEAAARALGEAIRPAEDGSGEAMVAGEGAPVREGTLRAPRRWEQLLVDAAVIGGRERWQRRLDGLARSLALDLEELEDPEEPAALAIRRQMADLQALRDYALPLLGELATLPAQATWGEWIDRLSALATRALRHPERVLATLGELAPMAAIGPIDLGEVRLALSRRLLEIAVPPPAHRHGSVFVAPADAARGLAFDVVCVPGLAERLFPREIREDPILLDGARQHLAVSLLTNDERVRRERLALRLAVGAARRRLLLTYPRIDLEKSRPRVPSFYGLEAMRATEGRLPGFDELATRAERVAQTRIGWPAPSRPDDAIDEAEHDLALLDAIRRLDEERSVGMARYLLTANPHLGRALRFRAMRWLRKWTPADGLVEPSAPGADVLRLHRLEARSYSATALQQYAPCPYRFLLSAIHRLAPREVPEAIDTMDALQRGSLVHEVQFELLRTLAARGLLPVQPGNLDAARALLDEAVDRVAERFRDDLAPAIDRVWHAEIEGIRADLREWLRRMSEDDSGFVPWRFELAFGLPSIRERDADSRSEPVALDCGIRLRGSIDLVERDGARLRVTDHKTGKPWLAKDGVLEGGTVLQPVLYAMAAEKIFPDCEVVEGRLYHCTAAGGYEVRSVPLAEEARASARALAAALSGAIDEGFFPAYPGRGACDFCDYRVVCGPYEGLRTRRKRVEHPPLASLLALRDMP